jgi:hypothetical protein
VLSQVPQHVALFDEGLAAVGAAMGPLVRVGSSMRHEVALAHEVLGAKVAAERALGLAALVVRAHVEEEVALQGEALAALGAYERPLSRVAAHVVYQVLLGTYKSPR